MKKSIFLTTFTTLAISVLAFGYLKNESAKSYQPISSDSTEVITPTPLKFLDKLNDYHVFMDIGNRFINPISKTALHNAKSFTDIFPKDAMDGVIAFKETKVSILHENSETTELGEGELLNFAQLMLIQKIGHSNNFQVKANVEKYYSQGDRNYTDQINYYMTVIPNEPAAYQYGKKALLDYLHTNSKYQTPKVAEDDWKSGKISFTVTKNGKIADVKISSSSGYPDFDQLMVELLETAPGNWIPAKDENGIAIPQTLTLFVGNMGC